MPTRKELIASGVEITPLTREEILLQGGEIEPLNVKERVLQGVVGGGGITPEGTITITENGTGIDVAQYATADVAVPAQKPPTLNMKIRNNTTITLTIKCIPCENGDYYSKDSIDISASSEQSFKVPVYSSENKARLVVTVASSEVIPEGKKLYARTIAESGGVLMYDKVNVAGSKYNGAIWISVQRSNMYVYLEWADA